MCRINKDYKAKMSDIFGQPNIKIELCNYTEYLNEPTKYYKVFDSCSKPLVDISVTTVSRHFSRYEIATPDGKKISCLARPRAVFHTPWAEDILEIYNWLQIRYLAQQTRFEKKIKDKTK